MIPIDRRFGLPPLRKTTLERSHPLQCEDGGKWPTPFDIDERVALNGNCDLPIAGESHSLFLTGGRPSSFSV